MKGIRRSVIAWTMAGKDIEAQEWRRHANIVYYNDSDKVRSVSVTATKPFSLHGVVEQRVFQDSGFYVISGSVLPSASYYTVGLEDANLDVWTEEHRSVDEVEAL